MALSSPWLQSLPYRLDGLRHTNRLSCISRSSLHRTVPSLRPRFHCAMSMMDGQFNDRGKTKMDDIIEKAKKYWDQLPQPVKIFPWNRVMDNFIQLILDLTSAVVKYLCTPLLAVSSLSEMSYCAHEKKLFLVPFPFAIGFVVSGILNETALEVSPLLKDAEVPWHLVAIGVVCGLLKLPGPYYPYWGRIFIPHFANGGLLRILWLTYLWYKRPDKGLHSSSLNDPDLEPNTS